MFLVDQNQEIDKLWIEKENSMGTMECTKLIWWQNESNVRASERVRWSERKYYDEADEINKLNWIGHDSGME